MLDVHPIALASAAAELFNTPCCLPFVLLHVGRLLLLPCYLMALQLPGLQA
jgi:hypothetical protein